MKNKQKCKVFLYIILAVFLLVISVIGGRIIPAFADTASEYSSVIEDLSKDNSFKSGEYPENASDYSIQVIQIAESTNGELFVYTYQPCQKTTYLVATKINMSLSESVNGTKPYSLTLLNLSGVFAKYLVNGINVSDARTRYYNITSIFRDWIGGIDNEAGSNNTINGKAFPVGQMWTAMTVLGSVSYEMIKEETVAVTSQMIGMLRYTDGMKFANTKVCDSHYIAFTCENRIDKLLSADIEFKTTAYKSVKGEKTYSEPVLHEVTLYDYQVASNDGSGWFGKKEEWHRMASVSDFIKEVDISGTAKNELSKYDWILNFYETEYTCDIGQKDLIIGSLGGVGTIYELIKLSKQTATGEEVSEVALLRLEFDCNGEIYNLGVVSDIQTGTNKPINKTESGFESVVSKFFAYLWKCIVHVCTGKATTVEKIVFSAIVIVAFIVSVLIVKLLKWAWKGLFK